MTGDGQRRGARRDDGVSLSDERGPKNGFGKPLCNESAGDKGTCSRAPEDLGAALWHTVSPMPWSYDSLARGGSLYPLTAGARGKYGGKLKSPPWAKYVIQGGQNGGGFLQPVISVRDAYRTMFRQYPDVVSVEQMSEMLGVSSKTGYRLLRENSIAHFRVGRSYRIPKLHILSYLQVISGS